MLKPKEYKPRLIEKHLDEYLNSFGAVCIEGPKYCGKTWTARSRAKSAAFIGDPQNNFQMRTMAQLSPDLVLKGEVPRLIDEWQEVPPLWDAVRFDVDIDGGKGKYILTGSTTPNHRGVMHSGTGRISKVKMNTMSLYETGDSLGLISLKELFDGDIEPKITGDIRVEELIYYSVRGGWPENISVSADHAENLAKEYLKTVIDDDMFKVDGVRRDINKVWSLVHSLGRNESTIVKNSTIIKDIAEKEGLSIDSDTVTEYLNIFSRLFIIDNQPSFSTELRSKRRILKSAKRHFVDPSLAVAAIGATKEMLLNDLNTFGFIFESLCEHDLKIYAEYYGGKLFHYRDDKAKEVDAIIEFQDGTYGAFEIKLGVNQIDKAAEELLSFKRMMEHKGDSVPKVLCVISGMSNMAYKREDGVIVVPITALRP